MEILLNNSIGKEPKMSNYIPANILEFAKRKYLTKEVKKVANWLSKLDKSISGGTAIGKYYDTLILDIKYQQGEISINSNEDGEVYIELFGEVVQNFKEFKNIFNNNQE